MFTGIIEATGRVVQRLAGPDGGQLEIALTQQQPARPLRVGQSIAVNGSCLTVVAVTAEGFRCDLSTETLRRTTFGELPPGSLVNLEWPLRVGDELGGHFVLGHVDGVGRIEELRRQEQQWWLVVQLPEELVPLVAVKGSLAVDGISLTVAALDQNRASFAIVPFTYSHTNLRERQVGDRVNLECDVLARYLARLWESSKGNPPTRP